MTTSELTVYISEFTSCLPLATKARLLRRGLTKKILPHIKRAMVKILLAEDDDDLRRFLVKALEKAGHKVSSFAEGLSAFEEIKQDNFDLLLTDIVMPEMDGIELARRAAELDPSLKIMFITGFAAVALNPDSNAPKDAKVLSKPFHLRDLVDEVNRLMAA